MVAVQIETRPGKLTKSLYWVIASLRTLKSLRRLARNGLSQTSYAESLFHAGSLAKVRSSVKHCQGALSAATKSPYKLGIAVCSDIPCCSLVSSRSRISWHERLGEVFVG